MTTCHTTRIQAKTYMRGLLKAVNSETMFSPPKSSSGSTRPLALLHRMSSLVHMLLMCGLRTQNGIALQSLFISIDSFGARRVLQPLSSLLFVFSSSYLYLPLGLVHGRCRVQDILSFACVPAVTVSLCLLPLVVSSSYLWSKYVTL